MNEKTLQSTFNRQLPTFIDQFPPGKSINIESKLIDLTKKKSIPFNMVQIHQVKALYQSQEHYLLYKIPDDSMGTKPFDLTIWRDTLSYICLFWYQPNKLKEAHLIPINNFINLREESDRQSITYQMSKENCEFIVNLTKNNK